MPRSATPLLRASLVAALFIASACEDGSVDQVAIPPASAVVESPSTESGGASSMAEGLRTLADMLPNAKWPWPEDSRAHGDILVLGSVTGARKGVTRPADPEPISADTPTVLVDFQVDRTISHDGEGRALSDIVTLEVVPGVPVGGTVQELVDLYSDMGESVFLLDLEGDPINDDVDGRVFWAGRVTPDGGLGGPNGKELDDNFARGIDTLDELEQQASKPEYPVDPEQRRSDPEYYGG